MDTLCLQKQYEEGRWFIAKDMNCDGVFTISDIWPLIEWVFFLPGDSLVLGLMAALPGVATFFELTPESLGGSASVALSIMAWLWALGAVVGFFVKLSRV